MTSSRAETGWRTAASERWLDALPGVLRDHPLARHTSFNIGGPAQWFVEAGSPEALRLAVVGCHERSIPCRVLGAGTNLLVADAGVEGLVVRCVTRAFEVRGQSVTADAGLKMMRVARIAAGHDLVGMEFAIGVPGSIGGAVYQDAGCWGVELREVLESAEGFTPSGEAVTWKPADLDLGYRTSALRDGALRGCTVTRATVRLRPGDGEAAKRKMAELTAKRNRSQPIRTLNCGSVFRNPPGDSAGRLVEAAGLRGARAGAAVISEQHANFIVNEGGARAEDVRALIARAQHEVRERFGVELEPEVELLGRFEEDRA